MKKLLIALIFILGLSSCSHQVTSENYQDYDIALFDKNHKLLFKKENNHLKLVNTIKRETHFGFLKEDYFETKEDLYIKTTAIGKKSLLSKINKQTLDVKLNENSSEPYTFTHYQNKLYFTTFSKDKFNLFEYNEDFKKIREKTIEEQGVNVTNDIIVKDNIIYLLIGNVDQNQKLNSYLFLLDMNFNMIEKIDISYQNAGYMRFYIEGHYAYITQNLNGLKTNGETNGSNLVLKLDLTTKNREFITLNYLYPLNIYKDSAYNKLIIDHYSLYVPNYVWSIYDMDKNTIQNISFNNRPKNENKPPFFSQTKQYYYFLFEDQLYQYDKTTLKETVYDLAEFNVEQAYLLIHQKDD